MSEQLIATPGTFGDNGNFLLERELGTGGMGGVYMGRDKMLDRPVAVKVMLKEYGSDPEFVEKFKKEAQAVAKLIHPNIAQIYSYGICDGMPYIAMELVAGGSLYSIMQHSNGKTDIQRVVKICQQVAQALQCASDQGFVHGDVKPENILLDANGNAKLVDFGLAAMQKDTDEIWGTPYYISPEKVRKDPVDFRADMYSLGGTLYHALTGIAPFEGDDSILVVKKRFEGTPKLPSEIRPEITPALDELVMKMLALEPADRYPSFEALLEAFKEVLTSGIATKPATTSMPRPTTATATGGKRVVMRRRTMMKKTTTAASASTAKPEAADGERGETPPPEEGAENTEDNKEKKPDSEDEEEGGNLGLKIVLFVVGGLLALGLIVAGLIWFKYSNDAAEKAAVEQQITSGCAKARAAIVEAVKKSGEFADEFDAFAERAVKYTQEFTDDIAKVTPQEIIPMLKPPASQELLDAIASTNGNVKVADAPAPAATTNAAPAAVANATNAAPNKAAAKTPAKAPATTNKPPAKATAPAAKPAAKPAVAKPAAPAAPVAKPVEIPPAVQQLKEVWDRAYGCQAAAIRIRHAVRQIARKAAEADAITGSDREAMNKLADLSRTVVQMFEDVKISKDVENVKKSITYIKDRGKKVVEQAIKHFKIKQIQDEREAKAKAAAEAEKAAEEKAAKEKAAKIEVEVKAAKDKFAMLVAQRTIALLDWNGAIRQIETMKADFTTPEGQLAADAELKKIKCMKSVQDLFIKKLKGYTFTRSKSKLKGYKVNSINDKEIQFERTGKGRSTKKLTWQKFISKDYYNDYFEIANHFIFNGRKNSGLSMRQVAEALAGAALTMQITFAEEVGAPERAAKLAQEAVKQFPEFAKTAQTMFPEMKFEVTESEE